MFTQIIYGILIPFIGTTAGSACVFFLRREPHFLVQRSLTGFAAGVMTAASVWSLLIPAMEQSAAMGRLSFIPAAGGIRSRNTVPADPRPGDSAPAHEFRHAGGAPQHPGEEHHAPPGGHPGTTFRREWRWESYTPGLQAAAQISLPPAPWRFPLESLYRTSRRAR